MLISFPVSHMILITSDVLYLPFKPQFLIWFLFYQAHVNFLLSSSVSLPLLFSSKIFRAKVMPLFLSIRIFYTTFPTPFPLPSDLFIFIFQWTTALQNECETTQLNDWCSPSPEFLFLVYSHSHPPELRVSVGTCHGD